MISPTGAVFTSPHHVDGPRADRAMGSIDQRWPLWRSALLVVAASGLLWTLVITAVLAVV